MDQSNGVISNPDPYYLKSVTDFSESNEVVSREDIYSSTGIKLVNKGTRLNRDFYDRLVKHKLASSPIDRSLTVKDAVTAHSLAVDAARLLDEEPQMARMANALPDPLLLRHGLARIYLNEPLAFKLTLAREKRPQLYQHCIRVALISLYLGTCVHLKPESLLNLATAAIFHDLGELHIDPALLDPAHQMTPSERRHIFAHPMIAYLILKEFPEYHPQVSLAVLDHHERLDGSGYPRSLKDKGIDPLGQILAVAEVAGSLCGRIDHSDPCVHAEIILKLNFGQFRGDLVNYLSALARHETDAENAEVGLAQLQHGLEKIARILGSWEQVSAICHQPPNQECPNYAQKRLASLKQGLFDAGFNPAALDAITSGIEQDTRSRTEISLLVRETFWQLSDIINEIRRRWPELDTAPEPAATALRTWINETEPLLGG